MIYKITIELEIENQVTYWVFIRMFHQGYLFESFSDFFICGLSGDTKQVIKVFSGTQYQARQTQELYQELHNCRLHIGRYSLNLC